MKKYRFENSTESIYEKTDSGYVYVGNYFSYGITKADSYNQAERKMEKEKLLSTILEDEEQYIA